VHRIVPAAEQWARAHETLLEGTRLRASADRADGLVEQNYPQGARSARTEWTRFTCVHSLERRRRSGSVTKRSRDRNVHLESAPRPRKPPWQEPDARPTEPDQINKSTQLINSNYESNEDHIKYQCCPQANDWLAILRTNEP
jgi:hypothetical protein